MKKKKIKKILVHIGPDKTGSSSIQSTLNNHRKLLIEKKIYYAPGRLNSTIGSFFSSYPEKFIYNILQRPNKTRKEIIQNDKEYFFKIKNYLLNINPEILIISSENLAYLDLKGIKRFYKYLKKFSDNLKIVAYLRDPLSYAKSAMSQRVKSGYISWDDKNIPILPYEDFLKKYVKIFGKENINLRTYSNFNLNKNGVVTDFLSLIDTTKVLKKKILKNTSVKNPSLSKEAVLIGDIIISTLDGYIERGSIFYNKIGTKLLKIKGNKIHLDNAQNWLVLKHSLPHICYLAKEFGVILGPGKIESFVPSRLSSTEINLRASRLIKKEFPKFSTKTRNKQKKIIDQNLLTSNFIKLLKKKNKSYIMSFLLKIRLLFM